MEAVGHATAVQLQLKIAELADRRGILIMKILHHVRVFHGELSGHETEYFFCVLVRL